MATTLLLLIGVTVNGILEASRISSKWRWVSHEAHVRQSRWCRMPRYVVGSACDDVLLCLKG
jgi:hypothetical protein